ncbi:MAG TPA: M56 family metallopeptidase [Verrucomicrobiae bacterium]|jgi:beta-lactamase regulating signal transducer with metallopeptidase domain|nr:M56 family metallopeptidase [Verrucomicrobiae bacterium]
MTSRLLHLLWLQSWQIAVLFAMVGLVCLCLRRTSAHWRYLLWLVVLVKCLVPPVVPVAVPGLAKTMDQLFSKRSPAFPDSQFAAVPAKGSDLASQPALSISSLMPQTRFLRPPIWERIDWRLWLVLAWAAGGLGYLMAALVKGWRIQLGLKSARTWPDMELECEFLDIAKTVGIENRPKLCLIRGLGQPFVWGVFRGSIYLPEAFGRQGTARERMLIMGHELAHVLRWDALINFVQVLVQAVFFFHPLVWWLNKIIRHEREKCCDEMAVASLHVDSREYGSAIVDRLADYYEPACPPSSLAISGNAKDLEDRVKSLLLPGRAFLRQPTVPALITVFLLAVTVAPAHLVMTTEPAKTNTTLGAPAHPVTLVDLSPYANASLKESWLPNESDNDLSDLSAGRHVLGGVAFEISGVLQLSAKGMPEGGRTFPPALDGIKLDRPFGKLHLLHACAGKQDAGTMVAKIVVHYQDGRRLEVPINYGEHVRDWWFWDFDPVSDPNTTMAWTGNNLNVRAQNGSLRLYRTTWINPRPQVSVVGVDYVSGQSKSAPFMVALTVE